VLTLTPRGDVLSHRRPLSQDAVQAAWAGKVCRDAVDTQLRKRILEDGGLSVASALIRPAASRRRIQGRGGPFMVVTLSSSPQGPAVQAATA
jgi:hypothetical protein